MKSVGRIIRELSRRKIRIAKSHVERIRPKARSCRRLDPRERKRTRERERERPSPSLAWISPSFSACIHIYESAPSSLPARSVSLPHFSYVPLAAPALAHRIRLFAPPTAPGLLSPEPGGPKHHVYTCISFSPSPSSRSFIQANMHKVLINEKPWPRTCVCVCGRARVRVWVYGRTLESVLAWPLCLLSLSRSNART